MSIHELTDKDLAAKWRRQVDKNYEIAQELISRGYSFHCKPHGIKLNFHTSDQIVIYRQETINL